ncbi:carotenoid biosynthesis protein [Actinomadura fibrosa]|uniref:carotenoid biosynthesis protein n=1 Tax=Actinomadura fibrosa TaxID=111802 RepID=UPI003521BA5E
MAAGALALTAWDLFLDPQMLRLGLWTWHDTGPYRGVPVSNFLGWLVVSALVMAVIDVLLRASGPGRAGRRRVGGRQERAAPSGGLVAIYCVMAVMETVAFAAVFEPPDRLVAVAGGVAMGIFAVPAGRRRWPR